MAPLRQILSMRGSPETHEIVDKESLPEFDFVAHEVAKYFRMLLKNNGYVLEQVFSPLIAYATPEFNELRDIARRCICRQHRHHFFHFGMDQWRAVSAAKEPTVKGLLYTYRPLLAGIHLMRTGRVESNRRRLNEEIRTPGVDELIARKIEGEERMAMTEYEVASHRPMLDSLCERLDAERDRSVLPDLPEAADELNDFLLRIRLQGVHPRDAASGFRRLDSSLATNDEGTAR